MTAPLALCLLVLAAGMDVLANVLLKRSDGFRRLLPGLAALALVLGAFALLGLALQAVPLGAAYAIWGGLGIVGAALLSRRLEGVTFSYGFRLNGYTEGIRKVNFQHTAEDFWDVYRRSTCVVERRRSQLLAFLAEGKSNQEALTLTRYSYQGADKIIDAYHEGGLASLEDQRHHNRGAPTLLSDAQLLLLARTIRADTAEGGVWNGARVQTWVQQELGQDVHLSRCYEFLDAVGYSRQVPRPRHVEADPIAQDEFKKKSSQKLSEQLRRVLKGLDER